MSSNIAIIGAASGKGQDYIQALLDRPDNGNIVAIVINKTMPQKVEEWAAKYKWKVIRDGNIQELIDTTQFDTALVALPHDQHDVVTKKLLEQGVYVVKEKPLGMNLHEVEFYKKLIQEKSCLPLFTTVQRSTHPLFVQAKEDLPQIGAPLAFTYTYTFNLPNQTSGWRSDPVKSGGGVVLDMGYHALDVVNDFFGYPEQIQSEFSYKFPDMEKNKLEDAAKITFTYKNFGGTIVLDRHAEKRDERFEIVGEKGKIVLTQTSYELYLDQSLDKRVEMALSKTNIIQRMFDVALVDRKELQKQFDRNIDTMRMIDVIYSQK
ncbi:MAG: Gfo/Idh/MocA family oxidoreductase [Verrucomicrobia bacterium]|nr:Gfo/Idh/MocA family oxidoreductase [Verrucomicrobiota bacterium]